MNMMMHIMVVDKNVLIVIVFMIPKMEICGMRNILIFVWIVLTINAK